MAPDLHMIVDVVDDKNQVISKAERAVLLKEHLNFRTVHVLLFDQFGRLILQRLASNHPRSPDRLGSTVAGYLNADENYLDAARRKLEQELQTKSALQDLGHFEMPDSGSRKFVGVFTGSPTRPPVIADELVSELVPLPTSEVDTLVRRSPELFTRTFVFVYDHFKRETKSRG